MSYLSGWANVTYLTQECWQYICNPCTHQNKRLWCSKVHFRNLLQELYLAAERFFFGSSDSRFFTAGKYFCLSDSRLGSSLFSPYLQLRPPLMVMGKLFYFQQWCVHDDLVVHVCITYNDHDHDIENDLVVNVAGTDNDESVGWNPFHRLYEGPSQ